MTKSTKKLIVNKQTLRVLVGDELADVVGGWIGTALDADVSRRPGVTTRRWR